jgi:hypothetical protein
MRRIVEVFYLTKVVINSIIHPEKEVRKVKFYSVLVMLVFICSILGCAPKKEEAPPPPEEEVEEEVIEEEEVEEEEVEEEEVEEEVKEEEEEKEKGEICE